MFLILKGTREEVRLQLYLFVMLYDKTSTIKDIKRNIKDE